MKVKELPEPILIRTHEAIDDFASLDEKESWHRRHAVFLRRLRVIVHIDLDELCPGSHLLRQFFENRSYHFAWPAPSLCHADKQRRSKAKRNQFTAGQNDRRRNCPTRLPAQARRNIIKSASPRRREVNNRQLILQGGALNPRIQVTKRLRLVDRTPARDGEHAHLRRRYTSLQAGIIPRHRRYSERT